MKRAAFRNEFGAPPANTVTSYQACCVGCVGGLGVLHCAAKWLHWREAGLRPLRANTQARNTSANIAACSAWVLGNRAGSLSSGDGTFSSDAILASPSFRASFVLRDGRHSKRKDERVLFVSEPCPGLVIKPSAAMLMTSPNSPGRPRSER